LQVTVYIRVVFLKIGEIDTLKENFMADAFIQARWREPALDGQASQVGVVVLYTNLSKSEVQSLYTLYYMYSQRIMCKFM